MLLGGFNPLKNMKVSWELYSQYILKEKNMFQTTNQNGNFRNRNMAIWPEIYGTNVTPFWDPGIPIEMKEQ
jgi:hypothetical protein